MMKKLMIGTLLAGHLSMAAAPAAAAEFDRDAAPQMGAFGGVRLRVALDRRVRRPQVRAALTLAPTLHSRDQRGNSRMRMGEGMELGFNGDDRIRLSVAGTPVSRMAPGAPGPDGPRAGVSPIGWVAIGVGVAAIGVATWFVIAINDDDRCCE